LPKKTVLGFLASKKARLFANHPAPSVYGGAYAGIAATASGWNHHGW